MRLLAALAAAIVLVADTLQAQDQGAFGRVIRIERSAFLPEAGLITFSEKPIGRKGPFYKPAHYGGGASSPDVLFGGFYVGQKLGRHSQCPSGASPTGCVVGKPTSPLALSGESPIVFTNRDSSNPRSPSLSGSPVWNGPISILFSHDLAGVGLYGGYFDAPRSTAIQAYDRNGKLLGGVKNIGVGMEYMALVTEDGRNRIAGLQFSLVGPEPAGFGIDDLSFAFAGQLDKSQVPALSVEIEVKPKADIENAEKPGKLEDLFGSIETPEKKPPQGGLADLFADD